MKVLMVLRQYNNPNTEKGFTRKEVDDNFISLFQDYECLKCGYIVAISNANNQYCPRCEIIKNNS